MRVKRFDRFVSEDDSQANFSVFFLSRKESIKNLRISGRTERKVKRKGKEIVETHVHIVVEILHVFLRNPLYGWLFRNLSKFSSSCTIHDQ